jgi:putative transposase
MPDNNPNFSKVLLSFKWNFTSNFKKHHNISSTAKLWQRGFWDHIIRNEGDLKTHLDYIHWNPVKHSYTNDPEIWLYSSYKDWKIKGVYFDGWGKMDIPNSIISTDYE